MKDVHVIYGYRSRLDGRWKVGCTLQSESKDRHRRHLKAKSGCRLFDNYLRKRFKEGKIFNDVFEYFQLRVFVCSRRDAERWEDIYTARYNALKPNGFNLQSGMYWGRNSGEAKRNKSLGAKKRWARPGERERMSSINKKAWQNEERRKKAKDYWKNEENRKRVGDACRKHHLDPKNNKRLRKLIKIAQNRPEVRKKKSIAAMVNTYSANNGSPEIRARISKGCKESHRKRRMNKERNQLCLIL